MEKNIVQSPSSDTSIHEVPAKSMDDVPDSSMTTKEEAAVPDASLESLANEKAPSAGDASEEEHVYVSGFKLFIVMTSITLVAFLMMLDTAIVATAIPRITSDFHSLPDVGWYGSAYLLTSCSLQPLTGKLYAYFHSKSTFLAFFAIFELGSLLCGVAVSSKMLIIGRAVAGLGSAGLMNGALTILSACVPLKKRPLYLGAIMSISQIGIVLGPLLGGVLTQYTTWRWCFYINLPIGAAVAMLLLLITIPDLTLKSPNSPVTGADTDNCPRPTTAPTKLSFRATLSKLDLLGFALFAPAAVQFLLALEWGGSQYAWSSATVIGLFCGAGCTFVLFLAWEYHMGERAMIPLSMVKRKILASSCLVIFFFFGAMLTFSYYLPIYFQAVRGVSPTLSGVYSLPTILSQMVGAVLSGYLVSKYGYYVLFMALSGTLTAIGLGLTSTFTPHTSTATWIGYQIITGFGRGCGIQMPIVAIQNFLPEETVSVGMALAIFSQSFGGALFLSFAETTFTNGLVQALAKYAPSINPQSVINAGASGISIAVSDKELASVLQAYNQAVSHAFWLAAGAATAAFVFCWGMGSKGYKKRAAPIDEDTTK